MLLSMLMLAAVALVLREHWNALSSERLTLLGNRSTHSFGANERQSDQLLRKWFLQGAALPALVWAVENLGIIRRFPPLVPQIALAQDHDQDWGGLWINAVIRGVGLITLGWGAVTYLWMAAVLAREARDIPEFRRLIFTVGAPMFVMALLILIWSDWWMLPTGLLIVFLPLVHSAVRIVQKPAPLPSYSAAVAKINFGKYEDAEQEVITQLEKQETDFQGWMMLAELYATKYHRFDDAAQVIVDLCNDPTVKEIEISIACNKLADWQLELAGNPPAARAALDLLIKSMPGSHFAHMAKVRLKQLPRTREDLEDQKKHRPLRLPSLREEFDQDAPAAASAQTKRDATLEANRLGDRLRDNPNDHPTRERLAILLAESLGQVGLGIEQLRLIVKTPETNAEQAAKYLAQIANWERRFNKNEPKFRAILAEITRDFPTTSAAVAARRQLQLIENEALPQAPFVQAAPIRIKVPEA